MGRHLSVVITSFYFSLRAPISPRKQEQSLMSLQPKLTRSPSNIYSTQGQLDSATWLERWEKVSVGLILQNGLANHSLVCRADCSERKPLRFTLISDGNLDAIYDVTIAYPDNLPETEADLANGSIPSEIHFHIKRYYSPLVNTHVQYKTSNTWKLKDPLFLDIAFKQFLPPGLGLKSGFKRFGERKTPCWKMSTIDG